jgi:hypothetical protein
LRELLLQIYEKLSIAKNSQELSSQNSQSSKYVRFFGYRMICDLYFGILVAIFGLKQRKLKHLWDFGSLMVKNQCCRSRKYNIFNVYCNLQLLFITVANSG